MFEITNPKIDFRYFPGFSLLFDNPGKKSLSPIGKNGRLQKINCPVDDDPCLDLYAGLRAALEEIGLTELRTNYLFFTLPPPSYHVTVWDGLNEGNKDRVSRKYRQALAGFLSSLTCSLLLGDQFLTMAESSPLAGRDRTITFQFDRLSVFGKSVLVARLEPANEGSKTALEEIERDRVELYRAYENAFGFRGWRSRYTPHVSLGYFGNEQRAEDAESHKDRWVETMATRVSGLTVSFGSVSLYGFTDMVTFFKRA